ncbi:MAG: hypothetical protein H0X24_17190 [Ktedonobacterales bacterium]|nr:hypothetical protein [Ktedonobacterales bacterium]
MPSAYTFLHTAISFLIIGSLALMVARIYLPWVKQPQEPALLSYVLPFRLRVRMQRANVYALAGLVVLGTVGRWINPVSLLITLGTMLLILALPTRTTLTKSGITIGRTPLYRWNEFSTVEERPGRAHLVGKDDWRPVDIWLPRAPDDAPVLALMRRNLHVAASAGDKRSRSSSSRAAIATRR